ncbi:MAG: hypothetical protein ABIJ08_03670 [Nanoarchaeota archaeon]
MGYGRNIGMSNTHREGLSHGSIYVGNFFTNFLFPGILCEGVTIENAFDCAVYEDTSFIKARLNMRGYVFDLYSGCESYHDLPQLRWQNADPSQLYLGSPPSLDG